MPAPRTVGVAVPEELSVVGVDDAPLVADALDPGLTTVALPHAEMGEWWMRRLLARIDDPMLPVERLRLMPGVLIERGSVAAPARLV